MQARPTRKLVVYPYNLGSESARSIAQALNGKRVRPNGTYRWFGNHVVLNWGASTVPSWATPACLGRMLNKPTAIRNASEKLRTFQILQQAGMTDQLPPWTTNRDVAAGWLANPIYGNNKNAVVCRTLTRANSGRGIVLAGALRELVGAPLYTRYKPKSAEFRIHVFGSAGVIDAVQKRAKTGVERDGIGKYIRSHDNGWVFCRDSIVVPGVVREAAERAVNVLGLDFGAVDIGFSEKYGLAIYEVNTAPGIEGQTLESYVNAIKRIGQL